ncbi:MAG TPA: STAS domain-containing protein [Acidimicrobiales bacterium]|jgi:anti-anti-sigma factor|nr:STAS domain-containing protein [Acidimicrobiales bacterium]
MKSCASVAVDDGEELEVRRIDVDTRHRVVIRLRGPLTVRTAAVLRDVLVKVEQSGVPAVVVDLESVSHIDAAGIGVLLASRARLRKADRTLAVTTPQAPVRAALQITGASDLIGGRE